MLETLPWHAPIEKPFALEMGWGGGGGGGGGGVYK